MRLEHKYRALRLWLTVHSSGNGDLILAKCIAAKVVQCYSEGNSAQNAVDKVLEDFSQTGESCAILALDSSGNVGIASNARSFSVGLVQHRSAPVMGLWPSTIQCLPQATFYYDDLVKVALAAYPSTPGHTKIEVRGSSAADLLSMSDSDLVHVMKVARMQAAALTRHWNAHRCALVTTGDSSISLLPVHGLDHDWRPVTSDIKEFHETYPGYVSSHDGPTMSDSKLAEVCRRIRSVSRLHEPLNLTFRGSENDSNLFAKIVRGELRQYRIWEDNDHVAFLTPYGNTTGFTVLVPRTHLSSDILGLEDSAYTKLVLASKEVARLLSVALNVPRCGMIFEGFEIDYAHVKLIPVHVKDDTKREHCRPGLPPIGQFYKTYPGFVTSMDGPDIADTTTLAADAA